MRDFTKSIVRFSWALPIFGINQLARLSVPTRNNRDNTAEALDTVSAAARDELGNTLKGVYEAGDRLQRGLVDAAFGALRPDALDPRRWRPGGGSAPFRPAPSRPFAPPPSAPPSASPPSAPPPPSASPPSASPPSDGGQAGTGARPSAPRPTAPAREPGWGAMPGGAS